MCNDCADEPFFSYVSLWMVCCRCDVFEAQITANRFEEPAYDLNAGVH